MAQVVLSVPEIHCGHCKTSIEGAVAPLDGVREATVDIEDRTVSVTYDEPADVAVITAAIAEVGFDVAAATPAP